jgi:AcrR family transcriptional regulator
MAQARGAGARSRAGRGGRQAILEAAIRAFQEVGYHGTSMRDIAGHAGITAGSIYNHFPSKQRILQEIMTRTLADAIAATRVGLLTAPPDPASQLHGLMRAWVLFHTERRDEAIIGISEIRSLDPEGRDVVVSLRDEQEAIFRDVVYEGTDAGTFATPHPLEAVRAIVSMGYTIANWYRADGPRTPEQIADAYAELALATVRGPSLAELSTS